jgi:hypothetical protein
MLPRARLNQGRLGHLRRDTRFAVMRRASRLRRVARSQTWFEEHGRFNPEGKRILACDLRRLVKDV